MKTLVTEITINSQQLKFLIDLMWGSPLSVVKATAERHDVDDVELESHLSKCLGSALLELDV
jgi:hypothetical protein